MMNVVDLMNIVTLARKGMSVLSEQIDAPHAEAGWKAIKNAEAMIAAHQQQAQAQSEQVEDTNVEVVTIGEGDEVTQEETPEAPEAPDNV